MSSITGIRAISFDGDQTLWDFQAVMQTSLEYVMQELEKLDPVAASRLDIPAMIAIRNRVAGELAGKFTNLEQVRLEAFKQTLREVERPDDGLAAHLNDVYLRHRFEDIRPYDDVLPVLNELKQRFKLGLLSNGNGYPERCGLEGIFDFVLFSQDCGYEKPAPEFYRTALETGGCRSGDLLPRTMSSARGTPGLEPSGWTVTVNPMKTCRPACPSSPPCVNYCKCYRNTLIIIYAGTEKLPDGSRRHQENQAG